MYGFPARDLPFVREDPEFDYHANGTWDYTKQDCADTALAELASMVNKDGGFVVIGVTDPKNNIENPGEWDFKGIESEYEKMGFDNYKQFVSGRLVDSFTAEVSTSLMRVHYEQVKGKPILILETKPSKHFPVYFRAFGPIMKFTSRREPMLFARQSDSKREIKGLEALTIWEKIRFQDI
jgi:predicted HTH transcriptional regulator